MQFKPLSLAALLCAYMSTALAADAGLPASCNVKNAGKACKKCIFNDNTLVDVCYRGVCGVITTSNKRASGVPPRRACERRGDNADDGGNFRDPGRVFQTLIFRLGCSLGYGTWQGFLFLGLLVLVLSKRELSYWKEIWEEIAEEVIRKRLFSHVTIAASVI
jgi:hypothetical protein